MSHDVKLETMDLKSINLFCHDGSQDCRFTDSGVERIAVDLEMSVYHIDRCIKLHPLTQEMFRIVFPDVNDDPLSLFFDTDAGLKWRSVMGTGYKHVMGRIDVSLKFMMNDTPFYWKYPEAGLHPKSQCNLGDLSIRMSRLDDWELNGWVRKDKGLKEMANYAKFKIAEDTDVSSD